MRGLVGLWLLAVALQADDLSSRDPAYFVRFLSHEVPGRQQLGLFGCGSVVADEQAVRALLGFGAAALPAIEARLGSKTASDVGWGWLVQALAAIRGPEAVPQLRAWAERGKSVDAALATARGWTSLVSDSREIVRLRVFRCRGPEPRDALDRLLLGWLRGDRTWLEGALGPRAKQALSAALRERPWPVFQQKLGWHEPRGGGVGYRFDVDGRWGEAEHQFRPRENQGKASPEGREGIVTMPVILKTAAGEDCGEVRVGFLTPAARGLGEYLVETDEMVRLLQLAAKCAQVNGKRAGPLED